MKAVFYVAAAVAILFLIATVYFMIPGIYHPYISFHDGKISPSLVSAAKHPGVVYSAHHIYAAAAFVVALACGLIAFLTRSRKRATVKVA